MDLVPLFRPKAMAVLGVSPTDDRHPANIIYNKNRLNYPVRVFPVNHRGGTFQGEALFTDISEVPAEIDLAVIAVRAERVPDMITRCIEAKVKGAVIISGGFSEAGRHDLQDRITRIAAEARFPFIGPNCLGIYCPSFVDTFFLANERVVKPGPGNITFISQSGGILVDQMIKFSQERVGLAKGVSIGNKAVIRETELLRFFADDPETGVIAFYLEGFAENEGREFVAAARECAKPVIVLKSGKSPEAGRAISSHTASLAGDYETFSSVLSQFGIVEARSHLHMVYYCEALGCYPKPAGEHVAIVTGSGGHGVLAVDVCSNLGLKVPGLVQEAQEELKARLSAGVKDIASLKNPVDLTGSVIDDDVVETVRYLSRRPEYDCIIILLLPYSPGISMDLGARLSQVYRQEGKPLIAYVPHVEKYGMLIEGFELNGVPVSDTIEGTVFMAEALRRYKVC
jgi:acetate---CoA ligase (ADP-forming)